FAGNAGEAVALGLQGRFVVAPAAPALVNLPRDAAYRSAVSGADMAITDSSLMVMLWNFTRHDNISRVSGLEYLALLLEALRGTSELPFFIMPSDKSWARTRTWLKSQGIHCSESQCYIAPFYPGGEIVDVTLLTRLQTLRPTQIVIALGGGTQ